MTSKVFYADVQWWDYSKVYVLCPFCSNIHSHGFGHSYENSRRLSHCPAFGSYTFKYPFSKNLEWTAYEIDKANKRYVALGASPPPTEGDSIVGALAGLDIEQKSTGALKRWQDAEETMKETIILDDSDPIFYETKRITHIVGQMVLGDVERVTAYLDSSSEAEIFLHGVNDGGDTALLLAACEKHPAIVELLLKRGADPNLRSERGRTPLMEAALWGRDENVKLLLGKGADKCIKDNSGLKAIDLAAPRNRNEEERYRRAGGEHQVYKEITYTANRARKLIVLMLKDDPSDQPPAVVDGSLKDQYFQKSADMIRLFAPIEQYEIPTPYKTIARLERGGRYPSISAMSGWSHSRTASPVPAQDWTHEVIRIATIIGHALAPDVKDNGVPGRYLACHAEKKLVAYFISKHVLLETDATGNTTQQQIEQAIFWGEYEDVGPLCGIAARAPPVTLKRASVLVSSPPCDDCVRFTAAANARLGLAIVLHNPSSAR